MGADFWERISWGDTTLGGSILFTENCGHGLPALAETSIQWLGTSKIGLIQSAECPEWFPEWFPEISDDISRSDGPPDCDWRECIRLLQHHTAMRARGTPKDDSARELEPELAVGTVVRVVGTGSDSDGLVGSIISFVSSSGRWRVRFPDNVKKNFRTSNLKVETASRR